MYNCILTNVIANSVRQVCLGLYLAPSGSLETPCSQSTKLSKSDTTRMSILLFFSVVMYIFYPTAISTSNKVSSYCDAVPRPLN